MEKENQQPENTPQNNAQPKMSYKDYMALKEKEKQKKNFELPLPVKIILLTPFLLIVCFGLFYLPWVLFQIATSPAQADKAAESSVKSPVKSKVPK